MPNATIAEEYFRRLLSTGTQLYAELASMPTMLEPPVEQEWLEFKGAELLAPDGIKKFWSESISAFANTGGGVLIWGLDCRRNGDPPVDQVSALSLVRNPAAFASRLSQLLVDATSPPVRGVEIAPVSDPGDSSRGFVLCYVPESLTKPHRAEQAQRNYFMRAGAASIIPAVSILRSLFAPGSVADLGLQMEVIQGPGFSEGVPGLALYFKAYLSNRGLASVSGLYK